MSDDRIRLRYAGARLHNGSGLAYRYVTESGGERLFKRPLVKWAPIGAVILATDTGGGVKAPYDIDQDAAAEVAFESGPSSVPDWIAEDRAARVADQLRRRLLRAKRAQDEDGLGDLSLRMIRKTLEAQRSRTERAALVAEVLTYLREY